MELLHASFHRHELHPFPDWGLPSLEEEIRGNGLLHLLAACGYVWQRDSSCSRDFPLIRVQTVTELYRLEQLCHISRLFEQVYFLAYTGESHLLALRCGPIRPEAERALLKLWREEPAFRLCQAFFRPGEDVADQSLMEEKVLALPAGENRAAPEEILSEPLLLYILQCMALWGSERLVLPYYGRSEDEAKTDPVLVLLGKAVANLRVYGCETGAGFRSSELVLWGIRQETAAWMKEYLYNYYGFGG